jgi:hypothetical protein
MIREVLKGTVAPVAVFTKPIDKPFKRISARLDRGSETTAIAVDSAQ